MVQVHLAVPSSGAHYESNRSPNRLGFTLIELMTVVAIIATLLAILLPAVSRVRELGFRVTCLTNVRSIATATVAFASDHRGKLPNPNWVSLEDRDAQGWLYKAPDRGVDSAGETAPDHVKAGQIYRYLGGNVAAYLCPIHDRTTPKGPTQHISSYLINGAVGGYGAIPKPGTAYNLRDFKPEAVVFWEAEEAGSYGFNDGSSYPPESLTDRHGRGATVASFDGSAEFMFHADWQILQNDKPGRLWCSPRTSTGE